MSVRKSETSFRHSGFLGQEVAGESWLSLCAPCSVREAEISAAKEGLGMCLALTVARKSLSLMSSWHQ